MDLENLRLTSTEVGTLWLDYMNDSMAVCTLQCFLEKTQDKDIRPIVQFALSLSEQHVQALAQIFKDEGMAVPIGFSNADVNVKAPPLFTDVFYLRYLKHLSAAGMMAYSLGLNQAVRADVVLSSLLKADDLSAPTTWDSEARESTIAPFSDKLMMQQITALIALGMANYGAALGASTRVDVAADYARLMAETAQFGEDGAMMMIKHGWLEQPPQAADRKELALSR